MNKSATARIAVRAPLRSDAEDELQLLLDSVELDPLLVAYLKKFERRANLIEIVIPGRHNDVAVVFHLCSEGDPGEIKCFEELQVFFQGKLRIERWRSLADPKFEPRILKYRALYLEKVRVEGETVTILIGSETRPQSRFEKTFDFSSQDEEKVTHEVDHPVVLAH